MEQTPEQTPPDNGVRELSDLQTAREIEEIERLLAAARDLFQAAPRLREEIAAEQRSLVELSQQTHQQLTRNAAMAERSTAAERICSGHLERIEEIHRGIEARVGEASSTLQILQQAGGIDGLARLRDELHRIMELSKGWQAKVSESLTRAEQTLGEVHGLLEQLGGLKRLATALERLNTLEDRIGKQEKKLQEVSEKNDKRAALLLAVAILGVFLALLCLTVFSILFTKTK